MIERAVAEGSEITLEHLPPGLGDILSNTGSKDALMDLPEGGVQLDAVIHQPSSISFSALWSEQVDARRTRAYWALPSGLFAIAWIKSIRAILRIRVQTRCGLRVDIINLQILRCSRADSVRGGDKNCHL